MLDINPSETNKTNSGRYYFTFVVNTTHNRDDRRSPLPPHRHPLPVFQSPSRLCVWEMYTWICPYTNKLLLQVLQVLLTARLRNGASNNETQTLSNPAHTLNGWGRRHITGTHICILLPPPPPETQQQTKEAQTPGPVRYGPRLMSPPADPENSNLKNTNKKGMGGRETQNQPQRRTNRRACAKKLLRFSLRR